MTVIFKETEFRNYLVETFNLNKDRMVRHTGENLTHLRIRDKSGIVDSEDFENKLKSVGIEYKKTQGKGYFSGSPDYYIDNSFIVNWRNQEIGVLLAIQKLGKIKRKALSPGELNLKSVYQKPEDLFNDVRSALDGYIHKDCLLSMLENIRTGIPIQELDKVKKEDVSRITSDFGETLVAYRSLLEGNSWSFTEKKNSKVIDGYENNTPVSVKNEKGGGKVNLSDYKDLMNQSTFVGKFLFALASHNKEDAITLGVQLDPELQKLIPDPSDEGLKELMNKTSYNDFYAMVSTNKHFKGLGIPEPNYNQRAKELWDRQELSPIHFTILTLITKIWGQSKEGVDQISPVVRQFLNKPKFVKVELQGLNISMTEQKFANVKDWKTIYWGRATAAWHNWPAVEPLKGI